MEEEGWVIYPWSDRAVEEWGLAAKLRSEPELGPKALESGMRSGTAATTACLEHR